MKTQVYWAHKYEKTMKYLLIALSIVGIVLLATQFSFLFEQSRFKVINDIAQFESLFVSPGGTSPTRFESSFEAAHKKNQQELMRADDSSFWIHLFIISLTALSTLTTSIATIKGGASPKPVYLIVVAALTFIATIAGVIEKRFSDQKSDAINVQKELLTQEVEFAKNWFSAPLDKRNDIEDAAIFKLNHFR
jgi:hypothetical protein